MLAGGISKMSKKKRDRKNRAAENTQFRMRLRRYSNVLAKILEDYRRNLIVPSMPKMPKSLDMDPDLFSWAQGEISEKWRKELERRRGAVQDLKQEIWHILEVSSKLDCRECAAREPGLGELLGL